jgi:hypothetical protein
MATSNYTNKSEHRRMSHSLGAERTIMILAVGLQLQNEACSTVIQFQCSAATMYTTSHQEIVRWNGVGSGNLPSLLSHVSVSLFTCTSGRTATSPCSQVFIDVLFTSRPCKPLPYTNHPYRYELLGTQHCHHGRRTAARETRKVSKLATVSSAGS